MTCNKCGMYYGASTDRCPSCGNKYIDKVLYVYFLVALLTIVIVVSFIV